MTASSNACANCEAFLNYGMSIFPYIMLLLQYKQKFHMSQDAKIYEIRFYFDIHFVSGTNTILSLRYVEYTYILLYLFLSFIFYVICFHLVSDWFLIVLSRGLMYAFFASNPFLLFYYSFLLLSSDWFYFPSYLIWIIIQFSHKIL